MARNERANTTAEWMMRRDEPANKTFCIARLRGVLYGSTLAAATRLHFCAASLRTVTSRRQRIIIGVADSAGALAGCIILGDPSGIGAAGSVEGLIVGVARGGEREGREAERGDDAERFRCAAGTLRILTSGSVAEPAGHGQKWRW
ncbi:hypothetical protein HDU93_003920, partial [Gonapodya sp. JEL0774]